MRSFLIASATLSLCVVACQTPSHRHLNGSPVAGQSFAHIERVPVDVGKVEVVNRGGAVVMPEDFVFSLPDQAILYFSNKFETVGMENGRLLVRIEEANVTKDYSPAKSGAASALGIGGEDRYALLMRLSLEHRGVDDQVLYGKAISAEQRFYVSEFASPAKRERAQLRAIEMLFRTLDPKIDVFVSDEAKL